MVIIRNGLIILALSMSLSLHAIAQPALSLQLIPQKTVQSGSFKHTAPATPPSFGSFFTFFVLTLLNKTVLRRRKRSLGFSWWHDFFEQLESDFESSSRESHEHDSDNDQETLESDNEGMQILDDAPGMKPATRHHDTTDTVNMLMNELSTTHDQIPDWVITKLLTAHHTFSNSDKNKLIFALASHPAATTQPLVKKIIEQEMYELDGHNCASLIAVLLESEESWGQTWVKRLMTTQRPLIDHYLNPNNENQKAPLLLTFMHHPDAWGISWIKGHFRALLVQLPALELCTIMTLMLDNAVQWDLTWLEGMLEASQQRITSKINLTSVVERYEYLSLLLRHRLAWGYEWVKNLTDESKPLFEQELAACDYSDKFDILAFFLTFTVEWNIAWVKNQVALNISSLIATDRALIMITLINEKFCWDRAWVEGIIENNLTGCDAEDRLTVVTALLTEAHQWQPVWLAQLIEKHQDIDYRRLMNNIENHER